MNEVTQESKDTTTKILAIVGFVAIIIFGVWLAVKVVGLIPGAFTSLASIADGVYNTKPQSGLVIATENNIVNTGESLTINWTDTSRNGNYAFAYSCVDDVSIDMRTPSGEVTTLRCDEPVDLGKATSVELISNSTAGRFTDVSYTVSFTNAGASDTFFEKTAQFTVVNATIPQSVAAAETTEENDEVAEEESNEEISEGEVAGESTTEAVEETAPEEVEEPVTGEPGPVVIEEPIFEIPTSNPNGFTDLSVTYLGVGQMNGTTFQTVDTIDNDQAGAFQFSVRNIGTKTSESWTFSATLPTGHVFNSNTRAPLRPNEQAIITVSFDEPGETGLQDIGAEITVRSDQNDDNDSFSWVVRVTD